MNGCALKALRLASQLGGARLQPSSTCQIACSENIRVFCRQRQQCTLAMNSLASGAPIHAWGPWQMKQKWFTMPQTKLHPCNCDVPNSEGIVVIYRAYRFAAVRFRELGFGQCVIFPAVPVTHTLKATHGMLYSCKDWHHMNRRWLTVTWPRRCREPHAITSQLNGNTSIT
jgi:hypothetical protein